MDVMIRPGATIPIGSVLYSFLISLPISQEDPMLNLSFSDLPGAWCRGASLILALTFFLGLVLGIWFSGCASEHYLPAMRTAVSSRVSIIGLPSSAVLPLLFSAFAVYLRQPVLLIPIAFLKAFLFSFLGYSVFIAWSHAGWLIAGLLMFGSFASVPVLYWYWQRHIGGRAFETGVFCLILGMLLLIGTLNYYLIVPFLANIINF